MAQHCSIGIAALAGRWTALDMASLGKGRQVCSVWPTTWVVQWCWWWQWCGSAGLAAHMEACMHAAVEQRARGDDMSSSMVVTCASSLVQPASKQAQACADQQASRCVQV
jgi:hypothetical protein